MYNMILFIKAIKCTLQAQFLEIAFYQGWHTMSTPRVVQMKTVYILCALKPIFFGASDIKFWAK